MLNNRRSGYTTPNFYSMCMAVMKKTHRETSEINLRFGRR